MSVPSKTIYQEKLNAMLLSLQQLLIIKNNSNFNEDNEFCKLIFETNNDFVNAGNEYIIFNDINIEMSEPIFTIFDYFIVLKYYKLNADTNDADTSLLIEKEVKLVEGDNSISFEDYPVYLQNDFDLLLKKNS